MKYPINPKNGRPDYTGGDHSFKSWFKIMWGNKYIQLSVIFLSLLIIQISNINWCFEAIEDSKNDGVFAVILTSLGMLIPVSALSIIIYKGFYQFWNDLKNGRSR